jgi:hypothetical protein
MWFDICGLVLCNCNKISLYSSCNSAFQYTPRCCTFFFRRTARLAYGVFPLYISSLTRHFLLRLLRQGCTNPACQIAQATRFCSVAPNICRLSAWYLLHVTILAPESLGFGKFVYPWLMLQLSRKVFKRMPLATGLQPQLSTLGITENNFN